MDDEQVVEADVVEDAEVADTAALSDQATVLISLGEMIKSHIDSIDRMRSELKEQRGMLEDGFVNNEVFRLHAEEAKAAAKKKAETRHAIMQQPATAVIAQKIKSMAQEIKEKQMALSDYLLEYARMANVNEVEGYDGEVREIVHSAKAVRKASKK